MTTLTLYALADQLAQTLDLVDENGELPEGYEDIRALVANKAANVAAYVAQRELEVKAMEDRLAEVAKRVKAQKNRCGRLREYLLFNMQRAGISEINSRT